MVQFYAGTLCYTHPNFSAVALFVWGCCPSTCATAGDFRCGTLRGFYIMGQFCMVSGLNALAASRVSLKVLGGPNSSKPVKRTGRPAKPLTKPFGLLEACMIALVPWPHADKIRFFSEPTPSIMRPQLTLHLAPHKAAPCTTCAFQRGNLRGSVFVYP